MSIIQKISKKIFLEIYNFIYFRQENETEDFVSLQITRTSSTPYQWVPSSSRMSNSQNIELFYMNGSHYNIPRTTPENEFEIWLDNQVAFKDIEIVNGETILPPLKMPMHSVKVPKGASFFLKLMINSGVEQDNIFISKSINGSLIGQDGFNSKGYFDTFIFLN